jgi:hypothetical protein
MRGENWQKMDERRELPGRGAKPGDGTKKAKNGTYE